MTLVPRTRRSHDFSQWKAAICAAMAVAALGAKLWIISRYANPTPLNDEWDLQAANLFVPWRDSTLSLQQLFAAANEHRMFTTRIISLLLIAANGLWDPLLEMIVNAVIHVAFGVCILWIFGRTLDRPAFSALALITLGLVAVPNAIENPVWGLETHFYCLLLFGLLAINALARESAGSFARRTVGIAAATLSFLSLASGALVFLVGAAVVAAKRWLGVEKGRGEWTFAALLLAGAALALALTPIIEAHEVYRAHSVGQFIRALSTVAGWPLASYAIVAAVVVNAPWLALVWRTCAGRRRATTSRGCCWRSACGTACSSPPSPSAARSASTPPAISTSAPSA